MRRESILLVITMFLACPLHAGTTSLAITSQPGDFVGQGRQYFFTPSAGKFVIYRGYVNPTWSNAIEIEFSTPNFSEAWDLVFSAPNNALLTPGIYEGAIRVVSAQGQPGLYISGDGRGCNMLFGRFEVRQVVYTGVGFGGIGAFWATFEQHCGIPTASALTGEIRYNADVTTSIPPTSWGAIKILYR